MNRCYILIKELLKFFDELENLKIKRDSSLAWERVHSIGSARAASILAARRNLDMELSYVVGALHDFGRFITGKQKDHATNGYEPVKEFLSKTGIFNKHEIDQISTAVKNHSNKALIGTPLEEVGKDCDILDCFLLGLTSSKDEHKKRLVALQKELDF